jgi:hypothetical protein
MEISGKSFNEYHRVYYQENIKGKKKQCECGELVDIFRFTRHRKMKKHLKKMGETSKIIVDENNINL